MCLLVRPKPEYLSIMKIPIWILDLTNYVFFRGILDSVFWISSLFETLQFKQKLKIEYSTFVKKCNKSCFKSSGDLKSWHVRISNGWKEVGLQMVLISNGVWNPEAQPFEILTNGHNFVKNYLKPGQKCPDFGWFSFKWLGTFLKLKLLWKPGHLKSGLKTQILNIRISDPHCSRYINLVSLWQSQFPW